MFLYLQQLSVGRRATGTDHLPTITCPRPLLDATRLQKRSHLPHHSILSMS